MKKEIRVTNSLTELNKIRDILNRNQIKNSVRAVANDGGGSSFFAGFFSSSRRARGSFGESSGLSKMYYVYVERSDYERAQSLV